MSLLSPAMTGLRSKVTFRFICLRIIQRWCCHPALLALVLGIWGLVCENLCVYLTSCGAGDAAEGSRWVLESAQEQLMRSCSFKSSLKQMVEHMCGGEAAGTSSKGRIPCQHSPVSANLRAGSTVDGQHVIQPLWFNRARMKRLFVLINFSNSTEFSWQQKEVWLDFWVLPINPEGVWTTAEIWIVAWRASGPSWVCLEVGIWGNLWDFRQDIAVG